MTGLLPFYVYVQSMHYYTADSGKQYVSVVCFNLNFYMELSRIASPILNSEKKKYLKARNLVLKFFLRRKSFMAQFFPYVRCVY